MSDFNNMSGEPKVTRMAPGEAYDLEIEAHQGWAMAEHAPKAGLSQPVDLLFLHGMASGGWMWSEDWLGAFTSAGYRCWTLTLPGRTGGQTLATDPQALDRALSLAFQQGDPDRALQALAAALPGTSFFDGPGIPTYTDALAEALARIDRPTVTICHSLGGAVAQNLMRRGQAPAGTVLLCAAPPYGLWRASMEMAVTNPELWQALVDFSLFGLRAADLNVLRQNLFPSGIGHTEFADLTAKLSDESLKAMTQAAGFPPFAPFPGPRGDVLVIGGSKDRFVPWLDVMMTGAYYATAPVIIQGGGHLLMTEPVWPVATKAILEWVPHIAAASEAA